MTYRQSMHIEAPVSAVFGFFKDPRNWADLAVEGVRFDNVRVTPGGLGTSYDWTVRIAGLPFTGTDIFTEFVPNRIITDRSSSSLEGTWTYSFAPEGTGTKLTVENRVRSLWRLPVLEQLLDLMTGKTHGPRFARITSMLEEPSGSPGGPRPPG